MFFSASTGGFYCREIHGDNMPGDVVEITEDQHAELLEGQSGGKVIVADENGFPVLSDPPPPTAEDLAAYAVRERDRLLALAAIRIAPLQDAVDLGEETPHEEARLAAWKQYRVKVNRITQQADYPHAIEWPVQPAE